MRLRSILSLTFIFISSSVFGADQLAIQIPKSILDRHNANCPAFSSERGQYLSKEVFTLPGGEYTRTPKKLYILGCELYAYNSMGRAYIVDSYGDITDVAVAQVMADKSITATSNLMGTAFDEAALMLSAYSKGRGIGDCGSSELYKYDANSEKFILREARLKDNCDGDVESKWPVVYLK